MGGQDLAVTEAGYSGATSVKPRNSRPRSHNIVAFDQNTNTRTCPSKILQCPTPVRPDEQIPKLKPVTKETSAPGPSASPVSWQTIFWALVPLAINLMTQPSGRICGAKSRYRIYLRCCPVICLADILAIIARLLLCTIYHKISLRDSFRLLLKDRFDDVPTDTQSFKGLPALRKHIFTRLAFFLLGALFPAVKLCSMHGVPWTKAWGVMFLASFVAVEILGALSFQSWTRMEFQAEQQHLWTEELRRRPVDLARECSEYASKLEHVVLDVACQVHVGVLYYAFVDLCGKDARYDQRTDGVPEEIFEAACISLVVLTVPSMAITLSLGLPYLYGLEDKDWFLSNFRSQVWRLENIPGLTSFFSLILFFSSFVFMYVKWRFLFLLVLSPLIWFPTACRRMYSISPKFVREVFRTRDEDDGHVVLAPTYWLLWFLYTICFGVLWYAYAYDPSGTMIGTWTDAFG